MNAWPPHLAERFATPAPRKLLSLDGGGIRGVLSLEVLVEIEAQLAEATGAGSHFRLCHYFDYIGGTSTGAIIAAGLAFGLSAQELLIFYQETGKSMFQKEELLRRVRNLYRDEPLANTLKNIFSDRDGTPADLSSERLQSLLLVVTRNWSTDSPWPISSNPLAKYNDPDRPDSNLRIPLWQLVRASTAAPIFFPPEVIELDAQDSRKTFAFVDGGVTPYNNPALLLYRMATAPPYRLNWPTGERNLLLVSVGTGSAFVQTDDTQRSVVGNLKSLPSEVIRAVQVDQDINCRVFGHCVHGAPIDRELERLIYPDLEPGTNAESGEEDHGKLFRYMRYDADLSRAGLDALGLPDIDADKIRTLDAIDQIDNLRKVGRAVAQEVRIEHFGPFV